MFDDQPAHASFTLGLRGYEPTQVDSHLRTLQAESAELEAQLVGAQQKVGALEDELLGARREIGELERLLAALFEEPPGDRPLPTLDDMGRCIEAILRASREQGEQLRSEAQTAANARLDEARAEALRLIQEATDQRDHDLRLRVEAESDRQQASTELAEASQEANEVRDRAQEATQDLQATIDERNHVVEQLRSLAEDLDRWLHAHSDDRQASTTVRGETMGEAEAEPASPNS